MLTSPCLQLCYDTCQAIHAVMVTAALLCREQAPQLLLQSPWQPTAQASPGNGLPITGSQHAGHQKAGQPDQQACLAGTHTQ